MGLTLSFFPLAYGVAFVCTAVKEQDEDRIFPAANRLFAWITSGILGFGVAVWLLGTILR